MPNCCARCGVATAACRAHAVWVPSWSNVVEDAWAPALVHLVELVSLDVLRTVLFVEIALDVMRLLFLVEMV